MKTMNEKMNKLINDLMQSGKYVNTYNKDTLLFTGRPYKMPFICCECISFLCCLMINSKKSKHGIVRLLNGRRPEQGDHSKEIHVAFCFFFPQ